MPANQTVPSRINARVTVQSDVLLAIFCDKKKFAEDVTFVDCAHRIFNFNFEYSFVTLPRKKSICCNA